MPNSGDGNPLRGTVIAMLVGEGWSVYQWWITRGQPDVFAAIAAIHAVVLATLYFRRSTVAGAFLFYSCVPICPLYFVATCAGWYSPPLRPSMYAIILIVWAIGLSVVWREKRKYERYIAPFAAMNRDPAEPRN
jgi:hypothetical protein